MSNVSHYLDCGCALLKGGGREWCPTCLAPAAPSVSAPAPLSEDNECVRCRERVATQETEFMGPLCAECYIEALEGICERKEAEIANPVAPAPLSAPAPTPPAPKRD